MPPLALVIAVVAITHAVLCGVCTLLFLEQRKLRRELNLRIRNEHCGLMLLSEHVNLIGAQLEAHIEHYNQHPNA